MAISASYWWLNRNNISTDDAEIDGNIYTISPRIAGRVTQVLVDDNQHVAAGQILVKLDDADERVALLKAQAQQAEAQAQLAQAQAQQQEMQADATQAARDFLRFSSVNPRATSPQQVDAAAAAIAAAHAKLAAAAAQIESARASLTAAQAEVADAQLQLSYTILVAPAAGHVATKTVQPGNVAAPGTPLLAVVGDDVWVTANYKETQLAGIKPGAKASIAVDAVPGVDFTAKVQSIQYGTGAVFSLLPAENATGNYIKVVQRVPVKLVFTDPRVANYLLAPGMSAEPVVRIAPASGLRSAP